MKNQVSCFCSAVIVFALTFVFVGGGMIACSGSGSIPGGGGTTTYTATLATGTGISSIASTTLAGATNATSNTTFVVTSGYQNPAVAGSCNASISGTTITVTFGSTNCSSTISATAKPTYTVSTSVGTGTTISPTSASVVSGNTTTFTVGLLNNYTSLTASGCGGSLSGSTYTTGTITANCTVTSSATPVTPGILSVMKSLRTVYDSDLLSTPICFSVQTQGTGFHVVVTRTDDSAGESATLNDSGNDCDATSGDGIFSGRLTMTSVPNIDKYNGKIGYLLFTVSLVNASGTTLSSQPTQLRVASSTLAGTVPTTQSGAFTIASSALFYNTANTTSQQDVAKAVYGIVKDVYDGLAISESRSNSSTGEGTQDYLPVRQPAVYGTGITSFFDNSSSYGSNGVLLGIIENDDGDAEWGAFVHEIGIHMLGCCYASNSTIPLSNTGTPHLDNGPFTFHDGQMVNNPYLVQNSGGDYVATIASTGELSQLEKYFARLVPASAVPSMCAAFNYTGPIPIPGTIIPAASVKCFTISDVVAQFGPVSPARTTTSFSVLPVIRYETGQMNDALVTSTQWMMAFYAGNSTSGSGRIYSFKTAMGGDATLSTTVVLKP